jgi:very-short-patch-repair endonuclease
VPSRGEELFLAHVIRNGLEVPQMEYKFLDQRRFRFDFAWVRKKIAVEVEGGVWVGGRHTRGGGYSRDLEKYNLATLHGWKVYRFTTQDVSTHKAIAFITVVMNNNKEREQSYENISRGFMFADTLQSPEHEAKD